MIDKFCKDCVNRSDCAEIISETVENTFFAEPKGAEVEVDAITALNVVKSATAMRGYGDIDDFLESIPEDLASGNNTDEDCLEHFTAGYNKLKEMGCPLNEEQFFELVLMTTTEAIKPIVHVVEEVEKAAARGLYIAAQGWDPDNLDYSQRLEIKSYLRKLGLIS